MPKYFQKYGYKSPVDPAKGPFQFTFDTNLNFWEYIADRPADSDTFNTFMEVSRMGRSSWLEWFDIQEHVIKGFKERSGENGDNDVLLVDVGGGHGHDLRDFRAKFPDAGGRLILQDRPAAIAEARKISDSSLNIEMMEHDFFTPQPVKGIALAPTLSFFCFPTDFQHLLTHALRCPRLLFSLCLPRLGGSGCPTHTAKYCLRHDAGVLPAHSERVHPAQQRLVLDARRGGHSHHGALVGV